MMMTVTQKGKVLSVVQQDQHAQISADKKEGQPVSFFLWPPRAGFTTEWCQDDLKIGDFLTRSLGYKKNS